MKKRYRRGLINLANINRIGEPRCQIIVPYNTHTGHTSARDFLPLLSLSSGLSCCKLAFQSILSCHPADCAPHVFLYGKAACCASCLYSRDVCYTQRHRDRRPSTPACSGCWAKGINKVKKCAVRKIIFCPGLTRAAKVGQKSFVLARRVQRTNQERTCFICTP
jgi:hypothetical protein